MSHYQLRLTASFHDCSGVIQRFAEASEAIVVYQHDESNRVHIHALVKGFTKSYDTASNWMKQICPVKEDRSFVTTYKKGKARYPVDDNAISYFSRGKLDPVFKSGLTDEFIAEYKTKGYDKKGLKDVVDVIAEGGKLVKQLTPSKKLQIQLLEEMRAELGDIDLDIPAKHIFDVIRKVCMRNNYYLPKGLHKIMEFRDNLLLYGNCPDLVTEFENAIARRARI